MQYGTLYIDVAIQTSVRRYC